MPVRYFPYSKPPFSEVDRVLNLLSEFYPMSDQLRQEFHARSFEVKLKKGDFLIKSGDFNQYFYFLLKGVVTGSRISGHKKMTTFICVEGDFVSAIDGMYGGTPSEDNIIAADESELIALKCTDLLFFFDTYPEMNIIMRKILEVYYANAHERAIIMRMGSAREKYEYFLKSIPGKSDRVSEEQTASFLDMKVSTLTKIKREVETTNKDLWVLENIPRLEKAMVENKLYQQKRITLKQVAAHLNITAHNLSFLLNYYYQKSFSDFINSFRINFVKTQLVNDENRQLLTVEALGDSAGFSSKSTFFSAFKKQTGLSPLEYYKNESRLT